MSEQVRTIGDFVKLVVIDTASEIWLTCCPLRQEEGVWEEFLASPFTRESVIGFAEAMAAEIDFEAFQWSADGLYECTLKNGHTFLQRVHEEAVRLGLDIELKEIDRELTPSEEMAGLADTGT